jgi:phosphoribosyl-ATP pyrophosphohydrolase
MKNVFLDLLLTIEERKKSKSRKSYTAQLIKEGEKKIAQKFGEESAELIVDYLRGSKKRTIEEAVDVIYHLFVLLSSKKIKYTDIKKELEKRMNVRGK